MDVRRQTGLKRATWRLLCCLLCLCLLPLPAALAQGPQLLLVVEQDNRVHERFVSAFRQQLPGVKIATLPHTQLIGTRLREAGLVVTLGKPAALAVERYSPPVTVIHSLFTRDEAQELRQVQGDAEAQSVLYLEQPPLRPLALVRAALPGRSRITVALGPSSSRQRPAVEAACRQLSLRCEFVILSADEGSERALQRAAAADRVLLLLPDPQVVNAGTARNLILGAYRRGVVLVAYSRALVKAGAVMAVHSTPEQLAMDSATLARAALQGAAALPADVYPQHYSVSVNYQLARALQLSLDSEKALAKAIKKVERDD